MNNLEGFRHLFFPQGSVIYYGGEGIPPTADDVSILARGTGSGDAPGVYSMSPLKPRAFILTAWHGVARRGMARRGLHNDNEKYKVKVKL